MIARSAGKTFSIKSPTLLTVVLKGGLQLLDEPSLLKEADFSHLAGRSSVSTVWWNGEWSDLFQPGLLVANGPLRVAAQRIDPPPSSVHFALDAISLDVSSETLSSVEFVDLPTEVVERLNTKVLTCLPKWPFGSALVWENGSIDLESTPPDQLQGRTFRECLPRGDGEPVLRRFIDDSVNILGELEMNRRREDEGLPPINVLWPHSQGFRPVLPNLQLRIGEPLLIASPVTEVLGLAYLTGFSQRALTEPRGLDFPSGDVDKARAKAPRCWYVSNRIERLMSKGHFEETIWHLRSAREYLNRLSARKEPFRLLLLPASSGFGLSMHYDPSNLFPSNKGIFDERLLEHASGEAVSNVIFT